jgi:hypothetical protein
MRADIDESGLEEVLDGLWLGIQELADRVATDRTIRWQDIKSVTIEHDRSLRLAFETCRQRDWESRASR